MDSLNPLVNGIVDLADIKTLAMEFDLVIRMAEEFGSAKIT